MQSLFIIFKTVLFPTFINLYDIVINVYILIFKCEKPLIKVIFHISAV